MRNLAILTAILGLGAATYASSSWSAEGVDFSPDAAVLVRVGTTLRARPYANDDYKTLYSERLGADSRQVLHRFEGTITEVHASPYGRHVGVMESLGQQNVAPDRANYVVRQYDTNGKPYEVYSRMESNLVLLDLDGKVLQKISGVYDFSWDPSGNRVAYITGDYSERGMGFKTTGTWIFDLSAGQSRKIHAAGTDVEWASWDGKIYIDTSLANVEPPARVTRVDPESGVASATSHRGIHFSPDGKYYFASGGEGEIGGEVFETKGDRQLELAPFPRSANGRSNVPIATGWLGSGALIVRSSGEVEPVDYVQDLRSGTRQRASGRIVRLGMRADVAVVMQSGAVVQQSASALPQEK